MSIVLTDEQRDLRELAGGVLGGHAGSTQLWHELSACGLVGLTVPVGAGGAGLGLFELALVAEQQGRHAVAGPLVPALLGAWVLARTGAGDGAARDVLADAARGADIVVAALTRRPGQDARAGAVRAACDAGGWRLSGERPAVAGLAAADHAVVLADADGEPGAFLVAIGGAGVAVRAVPTTSRQPAAHLSLRDAAAQRLDGDADWLRDALAAWRITLAATLLGVLEGALALAVEHVAGREQFGRPLGTFQSVAHRAADARIAATAIRVTTWHAAQVLDAGADATAAADVARWWAADAGERSVFELVHLHGGLGVDVEHPAHRRLLWARELTTADGGAGAVLDDLGREIAGAARAGTAEVGGAAA